MLCQQDYRQPPLQASFRFQLELDALFNRRIWKATHMRECILEFKSQTKHRMEAYGLCAGW